MRRVSGLPVYRPSELRLSLPEPRPRFLPITFTSRIIECLNAPQKSGALSLEHSGLPPCKFWFSHNRRHVLQAWRNPQT
jgi:hypothetical protein